MENTTVSKALRVAMETCGQTRYQIAKNTGVAQSMLSRFANGKTALGLDAVDVLAGFLRLALVPARGRHRQRPAQAKGKSGARATAKRTAGPTG